jgi:hypothetical protein
VARRLTAGGVEVVEVDRPNRQVRRRQGKTDMLDAIEAARAAQSGRAFGRAKSRDGNVEAIRTLVVAKRSARQTKTKALNQIRHLGSPHQKRCEPSFPAARRSKSLPMPRRCDRELVATRCSSRRSPLCGSWVAVSSRSIVNSTGSMSYSPRSSLKPHQSCSLSTALVCTPRPCYSSLPATTPNGSAAKQPGHICVVCHQSRHLRARSLATG